MTKLKRQGTPADREVAVTSPERKVGYYPLAKRKILWGSYSSLGLNREQEHNGMTRQSRSQCTPARH